jgi:hypothetical protein
MRAAACAWQEAVTGNNEAGFLRSILGASQGWKQTTRSYVRWEPIQEATDPKIADPDRDVDPLRHDEGSARIDLPSRLSASSSNADATPPAWRKCPSPFRVENPAAP